jgi:prophage DNA circulation protein
VSPLALELFRRLSLLALVLAALLIVVPWAFSELGIWGPRVHEQVGSAERALEIAREYGGDENDPEFRAAQEHLQRARQLSSQGERFRARQAARRACSQAIQAQRSALTSRESARRQSAQIATEIDHQLNQLEALYSDLQREQGNMKVSELLPLMKEARRAGASILLAIEEGRHREALDLQDDAMATIERVRSALESQRSVQRAARDMAR